MRAFVAGLLAIVGAFSVNAAQAMSPDDMQFLARQVMSTPVKHALSGRKGQYYVHVVRPNGAPLFVLVGLCGNGETMCLAVKAEYVVTKKEANYEFDTRCVATLTSIGLAGKVDDINWNCIAHTPFMEKFIDDNKQRIFDDFVEEALALYRAQ